MPDGERHKNLRTAEKLLRELAENGFGRNDAIFALGGGVIGDLAGFAASAHMRGISWLYAPTTLVAQIDASVGGKTAVNSAQGKNLIGAFHQPSGVLIDVSTLLTLPKREVTAGFCEAIKQGAVGSEKLFTQTANFLQTYPVKGFRSYFDEPAFCHLFEKLIAEHVGFKASIVAKDPFESPANNTRRSRKILNFGHTVGHAMEKITGYRRFRHGEAVGYGMIAAGHLSKKAGFLGEKSLELLNGVVRSAGDLPRANDIGAKEVFQALSSDKKTVGGETQWVLLEKIGRPTIVAAGNLEKQDILDSIKTALANLPLA
jgi:3-dehydroquinate synthase